MLLIYLMVLIQFLKFKIVLNLSSKKHKTLTEKPPVQIYQNKIKNRIIFKIKTWYKLELLTPETMNLLGSTQKLLIKIKKDENIPKLESVEVCNLVKNDYQLISKFFLLLFQTKNLDKYR